MRPVSYRRGVFGSCSEMLLPLVVLPGNPRTTTAALSVVKLWHHLPSTTTSTREAASTEWYTRSVAFWKSAGLAV